MTNKRRSEATTGQKGIADDNNDTLPQVRPLSSDCEKGTFFLQEPVNVEVGEELSNQHHGDNDGKVVVGMPEIPPLLPGQHSYLRRIFGAARKSQEDNIVDIDADEEKKRTQHLSKSGTKNEKDDNEKKGLSLEMDAASTLTSLNQKPPPHKTGVLVDLDVKSAAKAAVEETTEKKEIRVTTERIEAFDRIRMMMHQGNSLSKTSKAKQFPEKLMEVLSEEHQYSDIITWLPHGEAFIIVKPKRLVSEILPRHFKQAKYSSFTRKLHRWGFLRKLRGAETGAFYHKLFKRDRHDLCSRMTCQKVNEDHSTEQSKPNISSPPQSSSFEMAVEQIPHLSPPTGPSVSILEQEEPSSLTSTSTSNQQQKSQKGEFSTSLSFVGSNEVEETSSKIDDMGDIEINRAKLETFRRLKERVEAANRSREALSMIQMQRLHLRSMRDQILKSNTAGSLFLPPYGSPRHYQQNLPLHLHGSSYQQEGPLSSSTSSASNNNKKGGNVIFPTPSSQLIPTTRASVHEQQVIAPSIEVANSRTFPIAMNTTPIESRTNSNSNNVPFSMGGGIVPVRPSQASAQNIETEKVPLSWMKAKALDDVIPATAMVGRFTTQQHQQRHHHHHHHHHHQEERHQHFSPLRGHQKHHLYKKNASLEAAPACNGFFGNIEDSSTHLPHSQPSTSGTSATTTAEKSDQQHTKLSEHPEDPLLMLENVTKITKDA